MYFSAKWLSKIGPGLLYAGAAIGVSHLVQSTRAGASFGFDLIWIILLANLIKYPFFEIGPRFAAATGKSLLEGYQQLGNWAIWTFIISNFLTMFTIQAAVTMVTAGLAVELTGLNLPIPIWHLLLLSICAFILIKGGFKWLNFTMKIIISLLSISTLLALIMAFQKIEFSTINWFGNFSWINPLHIAFIVALVGWMPAPIDLSIWNSIWTKKSLKGFGKLENLEEVKFDFKIGFWITTISAVLFLLLGTLVMFNSDIQFSNSATEFSKQIIQIYTSLLGNWAYPIIAVAAFTTMFSTSLTCLDAFSRVSFESMDLVLPKEKGALIKKYGFWLFFLIVGSFIILQFFVSNMKQLVDFATTMSFLIAPVFAFINYKLINSHQVSEIFKPKRFLKYWTMIGLLFLISFSAYYLYVLNQAS